MAFKKNRITALIDAGQVEEAKAEILAAYRGAKASQADAAKALDAGEGTMIRWIERLKLRKAIDKIKAEAVKGGWAHTRNRMGGRPPKKKRARTAA